MLKSREKQHPFSGIWGIFSRRNEQKAKGYLKNNFYISELYEKEKATYAALNN